MPGNGVHTFLPQCGYADQISDSGSGRSINLTFGYKKYIAKSSWLLNESTDGQLWERAIPCPNSYDSDRQGLVPAKAQSRAIKKFESVQLEHILFLLICLNLHKKSSFAQWTGVFPPRQFTKQQGCVTRLASVSLRTSWWEQQDDQEGEFTRKGGTLPISWLDTHPISLTQSPTQAAKYRQTNS